MLPEPFDNARVLTGPTGAGKTELALDIAERLDAEIISMDSMALYRGMDIGTAKPTIEQRKRVRHHLVDVLDPWESASVAWWLSEAGKCCADIEGRGKQVLLVGGTPLYLKAIVSGLFDGPPADAEVRRQLMQEADDSGKELLHARLAVVDPVSARRLHTNDIRRVVRALEVFTLTGKPISEWQQQWGSESRSIKNDDPLVSPIVWLDLPRAILYERINRRVELMFASGLVDEVRDLCKTHSSHAEERRGEGASFARLPPLHRYSGGEGTESEMTSKSEPAPNCCYPLSPEARQALGYKEVIEMLEGRLTLREAVDQVQTRTRNLAKRQTTWFRHLPGCMPITSELTAELWRPKMSI